MAIAIDREKLINLVDIGKLLPNRPNKATLWRWHARGIRGIRLETLKAGKKRVTSIEAVERFFAAVSAPESVDAVRHSGGIEAAAEKLRRLNI